MGHSGNKEGRFGDNYKTRYKINFSHEHASRLDIWPSVGIYNLNCFLMLFHNFRLECGTKPDGSIA